VVRGLLHLAEAQTLIPAIAADALFELRRNTFEFGVEAGAQAVDHGNDGH
jgi:hypothetical protein